MNSWHDVSLGDKFPEIVNSIIEIPKGSRAKYELDKNTGLLRLDRVLFSAFYYPSNYGFIPRTYGEDKDPLDILVLSQIDLDPLCLVDAKVIGVMRMLDSNEADDKIIAVAANDISVNFINDVSELPKHFINELKDFFENYKRLEHKTVKVENFQSKNIAIEIIEKAAKNYDKEILSK